MADYKAIKGHTIETVAGDPSTIALGDIWYSNTTRKIRIGKTTAGSWASGATVSPSYGTCATLGIQTAALLCFGDNPGLGGNSGKPSHEYDGTSWTSGGAANTARASNAACGTQTAGLGMGGYSPPVPGVINNVESYDGSSWTEIADINTGRGYLASAGAGTTTAALAFGGLINPELSPSPFGPVGAKNESEEFDGSSWTEGDNLNQARRDFEGAGTQTAALAIGGDNFPGAFAGVESYDGSSWTEGADLNATHYRNMSGGIQTLAFTTGGFPASVNCETWDGTSWTEVANMSTGRHEGGGCGTYAAGLVAGGVPTTGVTEEWTGDYASAGSITSS